MSNYEINELTLPKAIAKAIVEGDWTAAGKHWDVIFPKSEIGHPSLYDLNLMRQVNVTWQNETRSVFLGFAGGNAHPGTLEPARSLLIGELDTDSMIALNFGDPSQGPTVVFLDARGQWVTIAKDFDDFWRRLNDA